MYTCRSKQSKARQTTSTRTKAVVSRLGGPLGGCGPCMPEQLLTLLLLCCSLGLYSEISRLLHRGARDVLPAQVGQRNAVSRYAVLLRFHTADRLVDGSYGPAMHGNGPPATTTCASSVWCRKLQWMVDGLVPRCQRAPGRAPTARCSEVAIRCIWSNNFCRRGPHRDKQRIRRSRIIISDARGRG